MKRLALFAATVGVAAAPVWAHHSYSMFDQDKDVVLSGTVKDWRWTNPHSSITLVTRDTRGKLAEMSLEGPSVTVLRTAGWSRTMMKPGDKIAVHMHPLRNGDSGGQIFKVTTVDGATYAIGPRSAPSS